MRRTLIAALAIATLVACSGDDSEGGAQASPVATERTTTTSTTVTPDPAEAFLDDMATELTFGEADGPEAMLTLAESTCDALDSVDNMTEGGAPNSDADTNAGIDASSSTVALATAFSGELDDRVVAIVLTNGGEHLCPQHADTIADYIDRAGIQAPGV